LDSPRKLKLPKLSAVAVALAAPLKVTVAPAPFAAGLMMPEMLNVGGGGAVTLEAAKFTAATLAAATVVLCIDGPKVYPLLLGVSV
jgi:hypothetical protein